LLLPDDAIDIKGNSAKRLMTGDEMTRFISSTQRRYGKNAEKPFLHKTYFASDAIRN
jgi:hypothetical protein